MANNEKHAEHQRNYRARKLAEGWKQLQFWVPPTHVDAVKKAVARALKKKV